jgi:Domain of Unknown Function (DUF1080)
MTLRILRLFVLALVIFPPAMRLTAQADNTLSPSELHSGWKLLFDGKTTTGWRGTYMTGFPADGWVVKDGELKGYFSGTKEVHSGGADIVTLKKYHNFDLVFDWKLVPGGNSGVKYFVQERLPKTPGSQPGYEYQLIDDSNQKYVKGPLPALQKTATIYDVVPANKPDVKVGIWHRSRIRVRGNHIEHWLDGVKVVDVDRTSELFQNGVKKSKFNNFSGFASLSSGYILLQDHGSDVAFKNIKIKELN